MLIGIKITKWIPGYGIEASHNSMSWPTTKGQLAGQVACLANYLELFDPFQVAHQHQGPIPQLARLDEEGKAKPLTRIVQHVGIGKTVGKGGYIQNPEYEDVFGNRRSLI